MHSQSITIHQHTYWNPLEYFSLSQDIYEEWSVFCIEEGTLHYQLGDEKGTASFGDILICPPNIPMNRYTEGSLKFHFIRFTPPDSFQMLPGIIPIKNKDRLRTTYEYLQRFAFLETSHINEFKADLLLDMFWMYDIEHHKPEISEIDTVHDPLIVEALKMMQERSDEPISIKEITPELGLSDVQFSRRFYKAIGVKPMDYLTSLRMRKARKYLLETDKTMEDIAESIGYQNGFYFSRIFKKKVGVTPSEFRKKHRK
ncbi:helix-turn-helix domain-containing protein [Pontibacillus marinus]|uniref:HTH araC/xylS-type domain-containing protein n=1 Tax=Pontibacillus marinus BH030004 = DSM 16465 TaxID=1385511 RepID=A0A0A5GHM9_9BACI|nr:AraC family transcriptional regulator [Pontibacillus marinus]KGX90610.1 hypothetical protein N783_19830 [Pontibacillus marinus BH030004 = DSM 16465]